MKENIGKLLQTMAQVIGYLCIGICTLSGLIVICFSSWLNGIIIIGCGVAVGLFCWLLCGLGHIIETLDEIRNELRCLRENSNQTAPKAQPQTNCTDMNDHPDL